MCLVVNAHDDWQLRFSDKFKRIINQFIKDNKKFHQRGHEHIKYKDTGQFRYFQDMKEYVGDALIVYMRLLHPKYTSIH